MSELKARKFFEAVPTSKAGFYQPGAFVDGYLKADADKVIALLTDKANYNDYAYKHKSEELADTCMFYEEELRRHKYKRCLAMAEWCNANCMHTVLLIGHKIMPHWEWRIKTNYWYKWRKRWNEFAEKFKPNNSTAQ